MVQRIASFLMLAALAAIADLKSQEPAPDREGGIEHRAAPRTPDRRPAIPSKGEIAKLPPDGGPEFNRLVFSSSPYLLQHARNPVDWHPWGDEAFERARKLDRPVFLSIGYSTCHWCHVMEHESFEDPEIAELLNSRFVPVKVDREERPDVDAVYMKALLSQTGRGGWPMSIFLTPDAKPFFCGTYFPPDDRGGRVGLKTLLETLAKSWDEERERLVAGADSLTRYVKAQAVARGGVDLGRDVLARAKTEFAESFDPEHGGFGPAPKFPRAHALSLLLAAWSAGGDPPTLAMVERTLEAMARGGLRDHLGGGFHRYATDREWLVPHFEKMLYDQALMVRACVEAYLATGKEPYAAVARETCDFVLRELQDPRGGFLSAIDADSEGVEGRFYVWTRDQILTALGRERGDRFAAAYGVTTEGNFRDETTRKLTGANILHRPREGGATVPEPELAAMRRLLFEVRSRRVPPAIDDKVLADWNGLMIGALAAAGRALDEPRYLAAAGRAGTFVLKEMRREGRLMHTWRGGVARVPGYLDDHAMLGLGLLDLYEGTFELRWLTEAQSIAHDLVARFWDEEGHGFHLASKDSESLIARPKDLYDGALPSGNSAAALFLLRLGRMTVSEELEARGRETLEAFSAEIAHTPVAFPAALLALDFALGPTREIVLAGRLGDPAFEALRARVDGTYLPRTVVLFHPEGPAGAEVVKLAPFVEAQGPVEGKAAAYVCEDRTCELPVTDPAALAELLARKERR